MPCDLIMPPKHGALSDDDDQTISMTSPPRHASVVVELKATNDYEINLLSRLLSKLFETKELNRLDQQPSSTQQTIQSATKPKTSPRTNTSNPTQSQPCPINNNNLPSSAATPNTSRAQQRYISSVPPSDPLLLIVPSLTHCNNSPQSAPPRAPKPGTPPQPPTSKPASTR
jgi:hypothetical protein